MSVALGALAAAAATVFLTPPAIRRAPARLQRTNVRGRMVPAILGIPVVAGASAGLLVAALALPEVDRRALAAVALILVMMGAAGWWDDLRGDERERGFRGHLGALARGRVTGGTVKIVAGLVTGVAVALLVEEGTADRVVVALVVPLGANLANLLDRAPGRAGKVALVLLIVGAAAAPPGVGGALGPVLGALLAALGWDLAERGMLGDAGANPVGAVAALGAALALDGGALWILLALLLAANLASERWSFSAGIERSRKLKWLDMLGRPRE